MMFFKSKNTIYIKWNITVLKRLMHSMCSVFKRNYIYIKFLLGKFIVQKQQNFEKSGLYTKATYLRKKMKPFIQITVILFLISFAIISQIIAIHNYFEDKKYVSQMNNYDAEKEEASLTKRILWTISK